MYFCRDYSVCIVTTVRTSLCHLDSPREPKISPGGSAGKESACNAGDLGSIPGLGRSPGERERLPTLVFWPGEFPGLDTPWGRKESDTTEQLSLSLFVI